MSEADWVQKRGDGFPAPASTAESSWKERPEDVRAEAARQVGRERQGQILARRSENWRSARAAERAPTPVVLENDGTPEPPIRRLRKKDPGYPSSWYRWRGERGRAYIEAWRRWSYGLGERPGSFQDFRRD